MKQNRNVSVIFVYANVGSNKILWYVICNEVRG